MHNLLEIMVNNNYFEYSFVSSRQSCEPRELTHCLWELSSADQHLQ